MELATIFRIQKNDNFVILDDVVYRLKGLYSNLLRESYDEPVFLEKDLSIDVNKLMLEGENIFVNDDGEKYQILLLIEGNLIVSRMLVFLTTIEGFAKEDESIYIVGFSVLKEKRNQGIATYFLNAIEKLFFSYKILLGVEKLNKIAYNLYKKIGYKLVKEDVFCEEFSIFFDLLEKEANN